MNERHDEPARDAADDGFERRAAERLRDSVEQLDGRTRSRLTQARHAALAELAPARAFRAPGAWLPAGALAGAAAIALMVWVARPDAPGGAPLAADVQGIEDLALLASGEPPELYADDPEFYEWVGADGEASRG